MTPMSADLPVLHKNTSMRLSIVIPCRNEKGHICEFLDSLMHQDCPNDWEMEILVADGLSDDGTRELLLHYAEKVPNVRIIDNPGRVVSTGLNAAIRASSGEIIIRMDAHTVYAPDYIRQCLAVLRESGADNVGGPWMARGNGHLGRAIAAAFQSPFCAGGAKSHNLGYEGEVDTVYLGCWCRSAFERFGFFDPELVRNQDDEFNFRIRRQGGKVFQSPRIRSIYTPRSSMPTLFRQYLQYGFWKVAVIRKHAAVASWRHVVPALFVGSNVAALAAAGLFTAVGKIGLATVTIGLLSAEWLLYSLACLAAALPFARSLELPAFLALPPVIATYHLSYGLGFLMGLLKPSGSGSGKSAPPRFFTALTR